MDALQREKDTGTFLLFVICADGTVVLLRRSNINTEEKTPCKHFIRRALSAKNPFPFSRGKARSVCVWD